MWAKVGSPWVDMRNHEGGANAKELSKDKGSACEDQT